MKKTVSLVTSIAKNDIIFHKYKKTAFLIYPALAELCPNLWTSCYGQERRPHVLSACRYGRTWFILEESEMTGKYFRMT